jgi:hypothetical protein
MPDEPIPGRQHDSPPTLLTTRLANVQADLRKQVVGKAMQRMLRGAGHFSRIAALQKDVLGVLAVYEDMRRQSAAALRIDPGARRTLASVLGGSPLGGGPLGSSGSTTIHVVPSIPSQAAVGMPMIELGPPRTRDWRVALRLIGLAAATLDALVESSSLAESTTRIDVPDTAQAAMHVFVALIVLALMWLDWPGEDRQG